MRQYSDTTVALVAAISLIASVGIGLSLSLPLLSLEMERMGVSGTAIGLNTALAGLASIVIAPFVPQWAARLGVGAVIAAALVVASVSLLAFKATMNYWAWMPLRFSFAASLGVLFILSEFWISSAAPAAQRGLVMGVYATVLSIGFAVGPGLLAVVGTEGWSPYLLGLGLFLLASVPLLLARGHWPAIEPRGRHTLGLYLVAAPLAAAAGFASGAVETGAIAMLPVLGLRLGMDASTAALLVSAVAVGNIVTQMPIGLLSDRMDRRLLLLAIAIGAIVASATLVTVARPGVSLLFLVLMVWGGLVGAFYTVGLAHLASRFKASDLVGANAAFVVMFNIGLLVGPPILGAGVDASPRLGFAAGASVFASIVIAAALYEIKRRTKETTS
jgi:MFS family permease